MRSQSPDGIPASQNVYWLTIFGRGENRGRKSTKNRPAEPTLCDRAGRSRPTVGITVLLEYQPSRMRFYRCHIDTYEAAPVVTEGLRTMVRDKPGFWQYFSKAWRQRDPSSPPFIGRVQGDSFRMQRNIRYRNSFLPLIWGHDVQKE